MSQANCRNRMQDTCGSGKTTVSAFEDFKPSKARDSGAETCSVVVGRKQAQFRQGNLPPQRGESATALIDVAAVTPKTALPRESQKGKSSKVLTGSQVEMSTGSVTTGCSHSFFEKHHLVGRLPCSEAELLGVADSFARQLHLWCVFLLPLVHA